MFKPLSDSDLRWIGLAALAVMAALLGIGYASHEVVRHIIQATPGALAGLLALRKVRWAPWAAAPVFCVWILIPALIWLYLLGIAQIIDGTFSTAEVVLTVVLAVASVFGLWLTVTRRGPAPWYAAAGLFVLFAGAQVGAMALSFQPAFAHD